MESSGMDSPHAAHCMVQPQTCSADLLPKGFLRRVEKQGHMSPSLQAAKLNREVPRLGGL